MIRDGNVNAVNVIAIVGEVGTVAFCGLLLRAIHANGSYLRKECGLLVRVIVYASFLAGFSGIPLSVVMLVYSNFNCPESLVVATAVLRVFSFRLEVVLLVALAVDRAVVTGLRINSTRAMRKRPSMIALALGVALALVEVGLYVSRDHFDTYTPYCQFMNGGSSKFSFYFFLVNLILFAVFLVAFFIFAWETKLNMHVPSASSTVTLKITKNLLLTFLFLFGVPMILLVLSRIVQWRVLEGVGNYLEALLQIQHITYFFTFCFTVTSNNFMKVRNSSNLTTTTITNTSRQTSPQIPVSDIVMSPTPRSVRTQMQ